MVNVREICKPQGEWTDTKEQATLRACLVRALDGRNPVDQMRIGRDLINLMRDQLMAAAGSVRQIAAKEARETMGPEEMSQLSGLSPATVSRLLTKAGSNG